MPMASVMSRRFASTVAVISTMVTSACQQETAVVPTPAGPASLANSRAGQDDDNDRLDPIKHIVVIYLENHSFDNLYGSFPGANGLASASATQTQVDATATAFTTLPVTATSPFPTTLANAPFAIEDYVPATSKIPD